VPLNTRYESKKDRNVALLCFSKHSYINKVLHHFNMPDAKESLRLLYHTSNYHLRNVLVLIKVLSLSQDPYSSVAGSLMHVVVCSRPNLLYFMSLVS
jgi:hypothetical protein